MPSKYGFQDEADRQKDLTELNELADAIHDKVVDVARDFLQALDLDDVHVDRFRGTPIWLDYGPRTEDDDRRLAIHLAYTAKGAREIRLRIGVAGKAASHYRNGERLIDVLSRETGYPVEMQRITGDGITLSTPDENW